MQSRASIISVALLISLFEVPCVNAQTVQKGEWVIKNNCSLAASSEKTLLHALDLLFKTKDKKNFLICCKKGMLDFLSKERLLI